MSDPLTDRLRSLAPADLDASTLDPTAIASRGRTRRRRRRAAVLAGATAVVVAAVAIPLATVGARHGRNRVQVVSTPATISGVPTSELTVDGQAALACGGLAPLSAYTEPGGAEKANTPEAAGLRYLIAHDVTGGESPQHGGDWVLLHESGGHVDFGQRTGAVGIDATVDLMRKGSAYVYSGTGGCGGVGYPNGDSPQVLETYTLRGDDLTVWYEGGSCDTQPVSAHVYEHADHVDLLVVQPPGPPTESFCAGVGVEASVVVHLSRPLGARTVRNIAYIPPRTVPSQAAARAQGEQEARETNAAQTLCNLAGGRAARETNDASYVVDVGVVREDVPAAKAAWRALPSAQLAAQCYESNGDHSWTELVATAGASPIVIDPNHTANLLAKLPDDHNDF